MIVEQFQNIDGVLTLLSNQKTNLTIGQLAKIGKNLGEIRDTLVAAGFETEIPLFIGNLLTSATLAEVEKVFGVKF